MCGSEWESGRAPDVASIVMQTDGLWMVLTQFACRFKTVLTPYAAELIAHAIVGGGITVEVAFLELDRFNQLGLEHVIRIDPVCFGDAMNFFQFHDCSP